MRNKKVSNIIKYNIKKHMKSKWFIALNIIFFIICIIAINFSAIKDFLDNYNDGIVIEIVDKNGLMYKNLLNKFDNIEKLEIKKVDKLVYDENNFESNRILIETNYETENVLEVKIIASEIIDGDYYYTITEATKEVKNDVFVKQNNISEQAKNEILKDANIETIIVAKNEYTNEQEIIFFVTFFITFMAIPLVLSSFSKEMFAEKTSKSSEYVLTTITAKEYMISKIGTALLNILIQGIAIVIYFIVACLLKSFLTGESITSIININSRIVKLISVEFILYVPYMAIMLIIQMIMSSKASDSSSSSSTEMIATFVIGITTMIPVYLVQLDLETVGFVYYFLSCIPMFSTFFIPALLIYHNVGMFHTIIALILYAITIPIILKIASQKIKNGILDYKPSKKNKVEESLEDKKRKDKIKFELERKLYIEKISKYSMIIGLSMIICLVLTMFVFPLIIEPMIYGIFNERISEENISLISSIITGILSLYIPAKFIDIYNKKEKSVKKESKLKWFLIGIPFVVLIFGLQTWIIKSMGVESSTEVIGNTSYWLVFIRLVLVPAIFEELLFRKSIFNLSKKYGVVFAVVISAILFGAIHLNFYQAIGAGLAGIVFAILTYKTGSLIPSMILHAMLNGYSFFANMLWINNACATKLLNTFIIGFTVIGSVILIENALKNKKKINYYIKMINKEKINNLIIKSKLLFSNYYFVFSLLLLIICFTINQKYIGMLL